MTFTSKRNNVRLINGQVHKHSPTATLEAQILRQLHHAGVSVPRVIAAHEHLLILALLPGQALPDVIEHGGYEPAQLAHALCDWFAAFAQACPGMSRGDVNGRNFLWDGTRVHAVDFEHPLQPGSPAHDAGRLAAFLATYRTAHTAKQAELVHAFMQRSGYPAHAFLAELVAMQQRRKL